MTDYLAPQTSPQSQFESGSDFDVTSVDSNFRAISAVEGKWRLPALPDEVKLDLATMPQVDQQSLTDFLLGIDHDLLDTEEEPVADLPAPDFMPDRSATDLFRVYAAGITQSRAPEEVTPDAIKRFKYEAMQKGYLGEGTQLDNSWSPELNSVRREMLYDDYNDRLRGNRPGAIPTNKLLETLGKWTSPTGLLAAATDLDLWWDFGAINREWSSWGDKWRKLSDSKNPVDFGKNLIDAVTGPIDDVVFPALNIALLASGLGVMANTGRIAILGARAAEGGRLMKGLYSATRLVLPSELGAISEASWTARRLMTHEGVLGAVGRGMAAWRELPVIGRTKQIAQLGMRAGFIGQAEDLLPGYQGGQSAADYGQIGEAAQHVQDFGLHSVLSTPLELALAPYNIFRQGTFLSETGLLSQAGRFALRAGGSTAGRAVAGGVAGAGAGVIAGDDTRDMLEGATYGALAAALLPHAAGLLSRAPGIVRGGVGGALVGAGLAAVTDIDPEDAIAFGAVTGASLVPASSVWASLPNPGKWVGHATDVLSKFSYKPIAEDQRVALAFQRGIRRAFELEGHTEALERWDESFRKHNSFTKAFAEFLGTDEEGAAAAVSYVTIAAAIDHTASAQARASGSLDQYHMFRNKLVSQLRTFDLDDLTMEEVARAAAIDRTAKADYTKEYQRILSKLTPESARELAEAHNEVARSTMAQLMSMENMPDPHQYSRLGPWTGMTPEGRLGVIEAYLPDVLPTFGNWNHFTAQSHQTQGWVNDGLLDGAEFLPVNTPFGSTRAPKANVYKIDPKTVEADSAAMDALLGDTAVRQRTRGKLAPLARMQPSGRFTLARHDTVTKQQLEEAALQLEDLVHAAEKLRNLTQRGVTRKIRDLGGISQLPRQDLDAFIRANGFGANDSQIRYLHSFMSRHGVSDTDLAAMIDAQIANIAEDAELWAKMKLEPIVRDGNQVPKQGVEALKARISEIRRRARYTAAEIDEGSVLRSIRESQGEAAAADMAAQFQAMRQDGYKLVHGVEYMMPHDLAVNTNLFKDIGVREMNAQTLGNAFGRRHPAVARMQQERRERAMLVKALADSDLGDFAPYDERITQAHKDLRLILNDMQDNLAARLEERHLMGFMARKRLAIESTFAPLRVEDLTQHRKLVIDKLESLGWSTEQAEAIFSSLRHFRNTEFKDLGFYAFEAKMRERNELVSALKFMGGSNYSNGLITSQRLGMAAGAFAGQDLAMAQLDENSTGDQQLGARLVGLVGGAAVGAAAAGGAGALVRRNGWIDDAIRRAEQRPMFMLADKLVRMRDGMRFGLSPIFDLSRYTEGLMLSQTGHPLRDGAGQRISLPLDMSPTGVKRRLGKSFFQTARNEYRQLGRTNGMGDIDVLDDAGHWFSQIGIMGFSPQDWQVGAYAELRKAGLPMDAAFHGARETHTYGTRGRSAAELSMNFVFFPFSFQKKAFTHVAKWLNDDLARSIMIHDGFAAYQSLNERYNLDEYWRDHIPALNIVRRFNLLAYGASPGRFGGINSQLFESLGRGAILFSPVGVNIQDKSDFLELQNAYRSLLPAINDINWMLEETKQSEGLWSETHQLKRGQVEDGYREWNEYRNDLQRQLDERGYTWSDLHNKPYLADAKLAYEAKRADLAQKYPGWSEARKESIFNVQALEMERHDLLVAAAADPDHASAQALMLAAFEQHIAEVKKVLSYQGVTVDGADGWTDAPPWAFDYLIEQAVTMLNQDPRFKSIWKKFYERELGPIEAKL